MNTHGLTTKVSKDVRDEMQRIKLKDYQSHQALRVFADHLLSADDFVVQPGDAKSVWQVYYEQMNGHALHHATKLRSKKAFKAHKDPEVSEYILLARTLRAGVLLTDLPEDVQKAHDDLDRFGGRGMDVIVGKLLRDETIGEYGYVLGTNWESEDGGKRTIRVIIGMLVPKDVALPVKVNRGDRWYNDQLFIMLGEHSAKQVFARVVGPVFAAAAAYNTAQHILASVKTLWALYQKWPELAVMWCHANDMALPNEDNVATTVREKGKVVATSDGIPPDLVQRVAAMARLPCSIPVTVLKPVKAG